MPGTDHAGHRDPGRGRETRAEGRRPNGTGLLPRSSSPRSRRSGRVRGDHHRPTREMGCSCGLGPPTRFTMDGSKNPAVVRGVLPGSSRDGLIYRGKRLVNWDPAAPRRPWPTTSATTRKSTAAFVTCGIRWCDTREGLTERTGRGRGNPVTWNELATRGYPGASTTPANSRRG